MTTWDFTLIVEGRDVTEQDVFEELYNAGCHDALIGQTNGVQFLDFDREAPTLEEAVATALTDIERVPGMQVVRFVDSDLVTISEIAERIGRSRESVRLLVSGQRGPGRFPAPVSDPNRPNRLWRWSEVHRWLPDSQLKDIAEYSETAYSLRFAICASIELRYAAKKLDRDQQRRVFSLTQATR